MKRIQDAMIHVSPRPDPSAKYAKINRLGSPFSTYRHAHDLTGHAKRFFEVTAHIAGLTVQDLVAAVFSFDRLMVSWEEGEARRIKEENAQDGGELAG